MKYTDGKFDHKSYLDAVMKAMKLDKASKDVADQIRVEISKRIELRIINALIAGLRKEDMEAFKKQVEENPDQDEVELFISLAEKVPGMADIVKKQLEDLFEELTQDSDEIDRIIADKEKKSE